MTHAHQPNGRISIVRGAALTVAMRWTDRLIGIVSTLILARLLTPDDFGIVAMASLVVALIDTLLDLGVNAALVQIRDASAEEFHSAWTLRLLQSLLAALIIGTIGGPLAAGYFSDPRVQAVLWLMALSVLVGGAENIGIVSFQKNMEFGREFRFFFLRRLAGFVTTLLLAFWLRSYWAMVFGALAGRLVGVGLSYAMHDFRPRLSVAGFGAIWSFSQWMLLRNLGVYGAQQIDKIVVGHRSGASVLGSYNLADDISAMPISELLAPLGRVLFPAFVQLVDKPVELRRAFILALGIQTMIALPAGVGLALVADSAVPVLLGSQWLTAIPLLQVLALISTATALTHAGGYLLLALGKVRLQAATTWGQLLLLTALLLVAFPDGDATNVAMVRLGIAIIAMVAFLTLVVGSVETIRARDIIGAVWRPLLATAVMAAVLLSRPGSTDLAPAWRLVVDVLLGGLTYAAAVAFFWSLTGRKDGAERYLLDKVRRPKTNDIEVEVSSSAAIEALPPSVTTLWESSRQSNVELGPEWFANLQEAVFPKDTGVRYYWAQRANECMAILPLRLGGRGAVGTIEALTNFYTSLYAPALTSAAGFGAFSAILKSALQSDGARHEMRFAPMDRDGPAYRQLLTALRDIGWVPFPYFCFGNWHLQVENDWTAYFAARPGEVRSTVKRMSRKFAAAGGTLEIVRTTDRLDDAISAYVSVYSASWKVPEPYPEFMPGLIRLLATSGRLRLGIARLNGRPIAVQLWTVEGSRAAIFKLAHREDSVDYSAGTLLTAHLMEHAISVDQVREVDYLIGDDDYKKNWMPLRRERWGIVAYNPKHPRGIALLLREVAGRAIKSLMARLKSRSKA